MMKYDPLTIMRDVVRNNPPEDLSDLIRAALKLDPTDCPIKAIDVLLDTKLQHARVGTHVSKMVHTGAKLNVIHADFDAADPTIIGTHQAKTPILDVCTNNGADARIRSFLFANRNGHCFIAQILEGITVSLAPFGKKSDITRWESKIATHLINTTDDGISCSRMKQLYFPVDGGYHLISPLFPTTLYDNVAKIISKQFDKEVRAARKANTYSVDDAISFRKTTVIVGGTKPQNAGSQINAKNAGRVALIDSIPPIWKSSGRISHEAKNALFNMLSKDVYNELRELKEYMDSTQSYQNKNIRDGLNRRMDHIIDALIHIIMTVRDTEGTGWAEGTKMNVTVQKILDPSSNVLLDYDDCVNDFAGLFAAYANNKLSNIKTKHGKRILGDEEYDIWIKLASTAFRISLGE